MMQQTEKKPYRGIGMEGFIARWYARNTSRSLAEYRQCAREVAAHLQPGARVLDLAPGPGFLAIELARLGGFRVSGLDISRTFVEIASKNALEAGVNVDFRLGSASQMPFEENSFDLVVCRAALKNFAHPVRALDEIHRVLRPAGLALILDLRPDAAPEAVDAHVEAMQLGRVNAALTRWALKGFLARRAHGPEVFHDLVARSAFGQCEIALATISLEVRLRKEPSDSALAAS